MEIETGIQLSSGGLLLSSLFLCVMTMKTIMIRYILVRKDTTN
jgi:hypothetical protein